jgi:hypothetical protein
MAQQRSTKRLGAVAMTVLMAGLGGAVQAANNSEQVVFSGIGSPPVSSEAFGLWVWCQNEPASPHARYETDCNGAIYLYARGIVAHVIGEITEPDEGEYVMDLETTDGTIACTLVNVPPIKRGPNNTVTAACAVNGIGITGLRTESAVVNATGP